MLLMFQRKMRVLMLAGFLAYGPHHAYSQIIPASRTTDWTYAGIPGGIPDTSGWPVLNVTKYGADPTGLRDSTLAIQSAIKDATQNRIYFPAGTYRVTNVFGICNKNVELCGDGPSKSRIYVWNTNSLGALFGFGNGSTYNTMDVSNVVITAGFNKGSTNITVSDASGFVVGRVALIDMLNDTNGTYTGFPVSIQGSQSLAKWSSRDSGGRALGQMVVITGVSGNHVTFTPPLNSQMYAALQPQICQQKDVWSAKWCGARDLFFGNLGTNGTFDVKEFLSFNTSAFFWVTNCEFFRTQNYAIQVMNSVFGEIRHNWVHEGIIYVQNHAYGILLQNQVTAVSVLDNIVGPNIRTALSTEIGANGCVIAYNYCVPVATNAASPTTSTPNFSANHAGHSRMNLFEGNYGNGLRGDFLMGTSSHQTAFRNYFYGIEPSFSGGIQCVDAEANQTYYNIVGNVMGVTGSNLLYQTVWTSDGAAPNFNQAYIYSFGYGSTGFDVTKGASNAFQTVLVTGNWDSFNQDTIWDAKGVQSLPNSLFLKAKPSWWDGSRWPPYGPDLSPMVTQIPAQTRFYIITNGVPMPPPNLQVLSR
jgi:hypothetical protein